MKMPKIPKNIKMPKANQIQKAADTILDLSKTCLEIATVGSAIASILVSANKNKGSS